MKNKKIIYAIIGIVILISMVVIIAIISNKPMPIDHTPKESTSIIEELKKKYSDKKYLKLNDMKYLYGIDIGGTTVKMGLFGEDGTLKEKTVEALKEENFKMIFVDFRPTAESFAKYFYDRVKEIGYDVKLAKVYETPNNMAAYGE